MQSIDHTFWDVAETNKIDPDDGSSTLCEACRLPIFSTPIITTPYDDNNNNNWALHDQCANDHLPPKLEGRHPLHLHPKKDLILQHQTNNNNNNCCCSRCGSICGSSFYKCPDDDYECDIRLDLACALTIKIVHRSHPHRLTVIKGKSLSSFCAACGTQHRQQQPPTTWQVWYVCSPCDFWVHPNCSLLPNAIKIDDKHHPHPLLLMYLNQGNIWMRECGICGHDDDKESYGWGCYFCFHCGYVVHTKCVIHSDPDHRIHFEPVKVRDAQVPGLVHLPMPNEITSVMSYIITKTDAITLYGGECSSTIRSTTNSLSNDKIHEHPLILHDHDDPTVAVAARICNACVQLISPSDPFYSCCTTFNNNELGAGGCRDFFLHNCCAQYLPTTMRVNTYPLTLVSKTNLPGHPFNMFRCIRCRRICNGFAYVVEDYDGKYLDVVCAFIPNSITHVGHAKSHILYRRFFMDDAMYICCGQKIDLNRRLESGYECSSCRNFRIHDKCALLPDTITHKFDAHPLKLITTTQTPLITDNDHHLVRGEQMFCEICENDIDDRMTWYYGCKECDHYFHTGCIPCVDGLSKIKFGFTIRVTCHACPLTCVRALSVEGYRCGCGRCERIIITESDELAFECSECYFRIRNDCVKKLLLPRVD